MRTRRMFLASLVLAAAFGNVAAVAERVYPSRPVTIVVPFAAAGRPTRLHALLRSTCGRRSPNLLFLKT